MDNAALSTNRLQRYRAAYMIVLNTAWSEYQYETSAEALRFKSRISLLFRCLLEATQVRASNSTLRLIVPLHCRAIYSISTFCKSAMTEYYVALLNQQFDNLYTELSRLILSYRNGSIALAKALGSAVARVDKNIGHDFDIWGYKRCDFRERPRLIMAWVDLIASLIDVPTLKELGLKDLVGLYKAYTAIVRPCFVCGVGSSTALLRAYDRQAAILWAAYYRREPWVPRVEYDYAMVKHTKNRSFYNLVSEGGFGPPHREVDLLNEDRISLGSVCCPESQRLKLRRVVDVDLMYDELMMIPGISPYELDLCRVTAQAIGPDHEDTTLRVAVYCTPSPGDSDTYNDLMFIAREWCHFDVIGRVLDSDSPLDKAWVKGTIRSIVETINATQEGLYSFEPFSFNPCFPSAGPLDSILDLVERGKAVAAVKRLYLYILAGCFLSSYDSAERTLESMTHDQLLTVVSMIHSRAIPFCGREKFTIALFLYRAVRHRRFRVPHVAGARENTMMLLLEAARGLDMYSISVLFIVHPDIFRRLYNPTSISPSAIAATYLLIDRGLKFRPYFVHYLNRAAFGLFGCTENVDFVGHMRYKFLLAIEAWPKGKADESQIRSIALTVLRRTVTSDSWLCPLDPHAIAVFLGFCNRVGSPLVARFLESPVGQQGLAKLTLWTIDRITSHPRNQGVEMMIDLIIYLCLVSREACTAARSYINMFNDIAKCTTPGMFSWSPRLGALIIVLLGPEDDELRHCLLTLVSNCVTLCNTSQGRFSMTAAQGCIFLALFVLVCGQKALPQFNDTLKRAFADIFFRAPNAFSFGRLEQSMISFVQQSIASLPVDASLRQLILRRARASFAENCDRLSLQLPRNLPQRLESIIPIYVSDWTTLTKLDAVPTPLYQRISKRRKRKLKRGCLKLLRSYERQGELLIAVLLGIFMQEGLKVGVSLRRVTKLVRDDERTTALFSIASSTRLVLLSQSVLYKIIRKEK